MAHRYNQIILTERKLIREIYVLLSAQCTRGLENLQGPLGTGADTSQKRSHELWAALRRLRFFLKVNCLDSTETVCYQREYGLHTMHNEHSLRKGEEVWESFLPRRRCDFRITRTVGQSASSALGDRKRCTPPVPPTGGSRAISHHYSWSLETG